MTAFRPHSLPALCALALLALAPQASADVFGSAETIARSWIGHDASELIMQWPVGKGLYTAENTETLETAYTYNFGTEAYYRTNYWSTQGGVIGVVGGGNGVAPTPIFQEYQHSEEVFVPAQHHCEITFIADSSGTITRYDFAGSKCNDHVRSWGRPKKR
ncbi:MULTISPECIES: hypothetical protein [Xanthomonas]|uniref:Secreted protein n=1 Tax=Xanthomonas cucurbitae TaxID=56453 RepID=A0ABY7YA10_9XANT|nr:hypothetical protein [Xanthomonas cucurbitae]QHG88020.1 hypothetical protein EBN15_14810 [Xanthomonas cucurbitae]WDM66833.1 hypothetical protein K6981_15175 [Xanthomonas cucurbitae]WDM70710.1 hypothetical protein K6978_15145 [Xanthomonas cucurbitae]WDM74578.1 hypothetical protein K6982_14440 [Xanthomonas cucurbitae]